MFFTAYTAIGSTEEEKEGEAASGVNKEGEEDMDRSTAAAKHGNCAVTLLETSWSLPPRQEGKARRSRSKS